MQQAELEKLPAVYTAMAETGTPRRSACSVTRMARIHQILPDGGVEAGKDAVGALFAGFPAGTVTGTPKIRAMEIIDEVEPVKREFYAGCIGWFSANGDINNCITLRSSLIKGGKIYVQAGCGVVADSNPTDEFIETENKAKALTG